MRRLTGISVFLSISLALMSPAANARAQTPSRPASSRQSEPIRGSGTELFRALLHVRGIAPISEIQLATLRDYHDVIVVIVGEAESHINIAKEALKSGGAVLIGSRSVLWLNKLDEDAGESRIDGKGVLGDRSRCLENQRDCPFVIPEQGVFGRRLSADAASLFSGDGQSRKELKRVCAGDPSWIDFNSRRLGTVTVPIARFPTNSEEVLGMAGTGFLPVRQCFAIAGERLDNNSSLNSRYLVFASREAFNNTLLYRSTSQEPEKRTDNLELCLRVIDYLQGPGRTRTRCVFIDSGMVHSRFDDLAVAVNQQSQPIPSINLGALQSRLIDAGNKGVDWAQSNGLPDKLLSQLPSSGIRWFCLFVLASWASLFLVGRLWSARKSGGIPAPPVVAAARTGPPGVFESRQREIIRRDNLYEPVRDLLQEFFASAGITGQPGPKLPKITISKDVNRPESLKILLKDLWRVAYGPAHALPVARWHSMEPYFEKARQAHANGRWQFLFTTA